MNPHEDHQETAARFAQQWIRGNQAHYAWKTWKPARENEQGCANHTPPTPSGVSEPNRHATSSTESGQRHNFSRFEAAARRATAAYPGPVGELISREISAFLEFGFYLDGGRLITQLVEHVLITNTNKPTPNSATNNKE